MISVIMMMISRHRKDWHVLITTLTVNAIASLTYAITTAEPAADVFGAPFTVART